MLMNVHHSLVWEVLLVRMVLVDLPVFVLLEEEEQDVKFVSFFFVFFIVKLSILLFSMFPVLSDPSSVCLNSSTLSPYNPLKSSNSDQEKYDNQTAMNNYDETNCNACICINGQPRCSNLWCGLPNCLAPPSLNKNATSTTCELHEVCVPSSQETCLSPPCAPRGDCRSLEPSRRVAPPKLPAPSDCWPNQVIFF